MRDPKPLADHTLMRCWRLWKASMAFSNARRFCHMPEHRDGALYAAYEAGYEAGRLNGLKSEADVVFVPFAGEVK